MARRGTTATVVCSALLQMTIASPSRAACGDRPGDDAAVAAARLQIEADCDCASAASHGAYVRCAAGVLAVRVATRRLRAVCKGGIKRCAARSTCGRPGAVACCRVNARGKRRCSVKADAARCRAPRNGTACVDAAPSCCDACGAGDCAPSTTATSTTTTTSTTATTIDLPCGDTAPACAGSCPAEMRCVADEGFPPTSCSCIPLGVTPCSSATYPACGGACSGTGVCAPVRVYTTATGGISYCACLDPASDCTGSFQNGMCPGLCPVGTSCYGEPEPAGMGNCVACLPLDFP